MSTIEDVLGRLETLESEGAIRRLMAEYLATRDFEKEKGRHIASLFIEEGIWEGAGLFAPILGSHHGREAIERRFSQPMPPSVHIAGCESISVNGDEAVGRWVFLQPTIINGQAHWVAGRYFNEFVRVDGRWKFKHIRIVGIFSSPYEEGWAKTPVWSM
jgi:hypothetical protein